MRNFPSLTSGDLEASLTHHFFPWQRNSSEDAAWRASPTSEATAASASTSSSAGAKPKKSKSKQQSSSGKKQQSNNTSQQQQQQQQQQFQSSSCHVAGAGRSESDATSVIREEAENGEALEETDNNNKSGGGGWRQRGQSAERRSRASTTPTTATTAKSKKFFDQWKQAASMSKLGNRTKNLLGKRKSHSQSGDIVIGNRSSSGPATPGANASISASGIRNINDGLGHGVMGSDPGSTDGHAFAMDKQEPPPPKAKAQWSEHVWSKPSFF